MPAGGKGFGVGSPDVAGAVGADGADGPLALASSGCDGAGGGAASGNRIVVSEGGGVSPRGAGTSNGRLPPGGRGCGCGVCVLPVAGAVGGGGGTGPRSLASAGKVCRLAGLSRSWKENRPDDGVVGMLYRAKRARRAASGFGGAAGFSVSGADAGSAVSVGAGFCPADGCAITGAAPRCGVAVTGASPNRAANGERTAGVCAGAGLGVWGGGALPPTEGRGGGTGAVWAGGAEAVGGLACPGAGAPAVGAGAWPAGTVTVAPLAALLVLTGAGGEGARGVAATTMAAMVAPG